MFIGTCICSRSQVSVYRTIGPLVQSCWNRATSSCQGTLYFGVCCPMTTPQPSFVETTCTAVLILGLLKPLSHYCVSTRVSTAYQDTKGTSRVHHTYVSNLAYVAHTPRYVAHTHTPRCYVFYVCTYVAGQICRAYVTHTKPTWPTYVWRTSRIDGVCATYVSLLWHMCDVLGIFCGVPRES